MPYPALSGLRLWNWIHRQFMLSVKVYKPLMVKWKHFAMGLKQWMPYLRIRHHLAMTPLEWCQAQSQDPIISQIIGEINSKTIGKMKITMGMPSELKALIRNRKLLTLKHGVLYKRSKVDARTKHLLVVPPSHRQRALEGCHDQVGHLGQDRVLDLLRDRFYWPGMHVDVVSYINSCPRCLRRKSQPDKAPLVNIETSQPLELIHLDYLKIEPSKGNIENVLVITDHFTRYAQAFPSKTQTALATAKLLWNNFILHYGFPSKIITDQAEILKVS